MLFNQCEIWFLQVIFQNITIVTSIINLRNRTLKGFLCFCRYFLSETCSQNNTCFFLFFCLNSLTSLISFLTCFNSSLNCIVVRSLLFALFIYSNYKLGLLHFSFHFVTILSATLLNLVRNKCVLGLCLEYRCIFSSPNCKVWSSEVNLLGRDKVIVLMQLRSAFDT